MDTKDYFESLSDEIEALKCRVRHFIDDNHWLTDGEWKESVLRAILNQHLPKHIEAVRGFVINENESSTQIDVFLFDNRKPTLFRDGNLVFATPDAVLGIIEVKSSIGSNRELNEIGQKLADNADFISNSTSFFIEPKQLFVGLFAFETTYQIDHVESLKSLQRACRNQFNQRDRIINHVTIGKNYFVRFWPHDPNNSQNQESTYLKWHSYDTPGLSRGYFLHNILHHVSDLSVTANQYLYFPREGKEGWHQATMTLDGDNV